MSAPVDWQSAFLAASALLGEPLATAIEALACDETAGAAELLRELSSSSKSARARTIARVMASVLASLDDRLGEGGAFA